jgi:hypothetical protein
MILFVRRQIVMGIALSVILLFGMAAGALAQESKFSARVLAKGSQSNILILVKNSGKSTESIYEFTVTFTQGSPISSIARGGWEDQRDGNTVKFTAKRNGLEPGSTAIFLIRVSDPAQSAFEWTAKGNNGEELQNGDIAKIKVREKKSTRGGSKVTTPEITVSQVRVNAGGQIVVTGKGFSATSSVNMFLENQQQLTTATTNANGEFSAVVIIPTGIAPGAHIITARDALGKSSVIQILIEGVPVGTQPGCTPGQIILTVCIDKTEYNPGDVVKLTGTAVLDTPVSLSVADPLGGVICGANPPVNNVTLTWEAVCFLPNSAPGGTYSVKVQQIVHKTGVKFTVKGQTSGSSGGGFAGEGENPGTLKLFTDKPSYKSGETVNITLEGARAKSLVEIRIIGIGKVLDVKRSTTDDRGVATHSYLLVGADPGIYKISATQDKFVVRMTFEVTA